MIVAAAGSHPLAYWYLTRATGVVALVLLTAATVLGVADVSRLRSDLLPRFVVDGLHRRLALLSVIFLLVHIATTVIDGYVPIGWLDTVVPFLSPYRTAWLGLGAVAFDILVAVMITSVLRTRIGYSAWRTVHWLAYLCWPIAVAHGIGTGTDSGEGWMLVIVGLCILAALGAVAVRLSDAGGHAAAGVPG